LRRGKKLQEREARICEKNTSARSVKKEGQEVLQLLEQRFACSTLVGT